MNKGIKQLNTVFISVFLCLTFCITAFADDGVKYSLTPTVTPIRIFFAVLVIILFVISEIAFEKIRNKRVAKRNKKYEKDKE